VAALRYSHVATLQFLSVLEPVFQTNVRIIQRVSGILCKRNYSTASASFLQVKGDEVDLMMGILIVLEGFGVDSNYDCIFPDARSSEIV
jgi:hypothetical protein